jgi:hypothetical protein
VIPGDIEVLLEFFSPPREVMITYIDPHITVEQLCQEMKDICRFSQDQVFTMKWVDEEGKCIISSSLLISLLPYVLSIKFAAPCCNCHIL